MTVPATRRALITGASAGIGAEFARQLAGRGADLVLVARRADRLEELAGQLRERGVDVEVLAADLTSGAGCASVEARLTSDERPIDLLVNNAGLGGYGAYVEQSAEAAAHLVALNVVALERLTHAMAPVLAARGGGGIINVASTAAFQPDPYGAVYGATKAFVLSLSEALHVELEPAGVRVLALCPGVTPTEFQVVADVDVPLPGVAVTSAEQVVADALTAFARGRAYVVPGWLNKVTAAGSSVGPSVVTRWFSGRLHRSFVGGRS